MKILSSQLGCSDPTRGFLKDLNDLSAVIWTDDSVADGRLRSAAEEQLSQLVSGESDTKPQVCQ